MPDLGSELVIGDVVVPRGTRTIVRLPAAESPLGTPEVFGVAVVRGAPGPIMYVGAGVHGDEVDGVHVAAGFLDRLIPAELTGTVIVVPVQNPIGFRALHRLPLDVLLHSPFDQGPGDMCLAHPGDAHGNTTQIMADALFRQVIRRTDYFVDLHTPATGGKYVPHAVLPHASFGPLVQRAAQLARALGVAYVHGPGADANAAVGRVENVAAPLGLVGLLVEFGEGGRHDPGLVEWAIDGLDNVSRLIGVLAGEVTATPELTWLASTTSLRAQRGGLLRTYASIGAHLRARDVIADVVSPFGERLETLESPHDGVLVRIATFPAVWSGDKVAEIGVAAA